jgi:hypothetical protein
MKPMKYSLQKIPLFISLILFVFLCFAFWFLYRTINNNNQKAEQETATLQAEARRRDDITSLDRLLQEVAPDRTLLETHFAKSSDVVPFLDTIEQLAPKVGALAQINSVNAGTDGPGLIVELKASGNFQSIYKFLTLLESSPYELDFLSMDIHTVSADASGKTAKTSQWEAVFKMKLLSFIQEIK